MKAQKDYKQQADHRRQEGPEFKVGDKVYLDSQNFITKGCKKLSPKFFEPYEISNQINEVAFRLKLLQGWRRHQTFHKGLLKVAHGAQEEAQEEPEEKEIFELDKILKYKKKGKGFKYLVSWKGYEWYDSSWEPEANLKGCSTILTEYKKLNNL